MAFYPPKWKIWRSKSLEVSPSRSLWEIACVDWNWSIFYLSAWNFRKLAVAKVLHKTFLLVLFEWCLVAVTLQWLVLLAKQMLGQMLLGPWTPLRNAVCMRRGPPRQDQSHTVYSQLLLSNTYGCFKWEATPWTLFLWASVFSSQKWE